MHRRPTPLPLLALLPLAFLAGCRGALELVPSDADVVLASHRLDAPDPAERGRYVVRSLYYGSGTDRRRLEYRDSVALRTPTVDASKLVKLTKAQEKERNGYWGFGPDSFPLNARVWYPEGNGPFPLVLIVHGNHNMKEYSDPGYGYLGELLASRGYILASIDENFLNGSIRNENDARGWMLLQHLKLWREFNETEGNPFRGRVDPRRIALIGHSRGGEAVGHAAAFNRLKHYPDDASLEFDFNFGIRSIIAIAPVDGQYRPAEKLVPVDDVNYLVFHGSHDGDVTSFMGIRQYQRVRFTRGGERRFKAAVYVYRANHGQWNTVWGPNDSGRRSGRILDLRGLLDPGDQRRFAEVYISAFLEATLRDDARYLPLFRDHRVAGGWLPMTMYATRFQDSEYRPVATFEEDIDVTTGTVAGVAFRGDSLATWKESGLDLRSANSPAEGSGQHNNAVTLGWNNRIAGEDTTRMGPPAAYVMTLPDSLAPAWNLAGDDATLSFLLAPTFDVPGPRKAPKAEAGEGARDVATKARPKTREKPEEKKDPLKDRTPIDLTIEVADRAGNRARLPLSRYGVARKPLETHVLRRRDREKRAFANPWDLILQSYTIPLADFRAANPTLDAGALREVRFVFDLTPAGTVVLDEIGFSALDPAFRVAARP